MEAKDIYPKDVRTIAQEQFEKHRAVFDSLKAYDEGTKEISTAAVERHLGDLQKKSLK